MVERASLAPAPQPHPRTLGWVGVTALAMGGSNQSLFLIGALLAAQGSAAVPLLIAGLALGWAAAPGWVELVLMWPKRVGGIAATCAEAFRPYGAVLANLTGVCYWWGWVPTCGLTALLSATALHEWYLPMVPVPVLATSIVIGFTAVNLLGVWWVTRLAVPIAAVSASLAFLSSLVPVWTGHVDWHRAVASHLDTPFAGWFGGLTSAMAGLYLIGFAAPAFEAAACHVGEMKDPNRSLPRAVFASAAMASVYFIVLPIIWLGVFGPKPLEADLDDILGPTFAPIFGGLAKSMAVWFMVANMFHGTLQPLAGAARTLSQLSEDGLLPRVLARRTQGSDAPYVATVLTAVLAIVFLLAGDPIWLVAAANLTYLIGIGLPNVAVWLLRRNEPERHRPWRAPRGTVELGVVAAGIWALSTVLGFEQFGLPTVIFGIAFAYSGSILYAWRAMDDRRRAGLPLRLRSLHTKLTGAMLAVIALDGAGYLLAVTNLERVGRENLVTLCQDIFVAVALLTISVGLVLPGMIGHTTGQVAGAASRLASRTLANLTEALEALGRGDIDRPLAPSIVQPVVIRSHDELGDMSATFNQMQDAIARAEIAMVAARSRLQSNREELQHAAFHDSLTGLANRNLFMERLRAAAARTMRSKGQLGVVFMDLDEFKVVNDSLGHAAGDNVLIQVASRLTSVVRDGDLLARLGGDEFVLLCESVDSELDVVAVVERIQGALDKPVRVRGSAIHVTASIGLVIDSGRSGADELLRDADTAMYRAKEHGRNAYRIFDDSMHNRALDRLRLESRLRDALAADQLEVWYQPVARCSDGLVVSAEALARWRSEDMGIVLPERFIKVAEGAGLIDQIAQVVMSRSAKQMKSWAQPTGTPPITLSFNVSARQLVEPQLAVEVSRMIRASGLPAEAFIAELTESVLMEDIDLSSVVLSDLKELGIRLAVDDFGTGYSSLAYLSRLPLDVLKVDRSFVRHLTVDEKSRALVGGVVSLAHNLGLEVTAEGVETREQMDILTEMECDHVQGFLIGGPVTADEFRMRWLAAAEFSDTAAS